MEGGGGSYQNHVHGHGGSCLEIIKFTFQRFLGSFFYFLFHYIIKPVVLEFMTNEDIKMLVRVK